MLGWDVGNGVARRAWAGNGGADAAIRRAMAGDSRLLVTLPERADERIVSAALGR
jgi:urocanate hydratase